LQEWRRGEVVAREIVDPQIHRAVVLVRNGDPEGSACAAVEAVLRKTIQELVALGDWPGDLPKSA
jgi:hypothetical protein